MSSLVNPRTARISDEDDDPDYNEADEKKQRK